MASKKKVLLLSTLSPYPFWAGSENLWYHFVCNDKVRDKIEFTILLADSPATREKAKRLEEKGLKVKFFQHPNANTAKRVYNKLKGKLFPKGFHAYSWYKEIKEDDYDLVFINVAVISDLLGLQYAKELCVTRNTPFWLLLQQGNENYFLDNANDLALYTDVAEAAKRFIFIAEKNKYVTERAIGRELKNAYSTVNAIPASFIEKGRKIDLSKSLNSAEELRFFNMGRFSPKEKAQHLLLGALAGPQWRDRNWTMTFIGVNDFGKEYLEKLIRFFKIDTRKIRMIGHISDIASEIEKQDVLVMPSLAEGTPFAMIEAMALGRPAVGTPVGGIPELIIDGKTGWLCEGAEVALVNRKLEEVWNERHRILERGEASRKLIQDHYNQDVVFEELCSLLLADSAKKTVA